MADLDPERIAGRRIDEIATREGCTAIFPVPHDAGQERWDPDEELPFAPRTWCGTCDDLTLGVADAVRLPKEAFDPEADSGRIRGEVVVGIHAHLEPRPWETGE